MKIKVFLSFFIISLLFSSVLLTARQAAQQNQDKLTFPIVGGRDGFIKRFGDVIPYRQLFYSQTRKRWPKNFC